MKRPNWKIIAAIGAPVIVGVFLMKRGGMLEPANTAQTSPDHPESFLRTRRFSGDLPTVGAAVQSTLAGLKTYGRSWSIKQIRRDSQSMSFKTEVPVLTFTDDLLVTLRSEGKSTTCDVRSSSRVGNGDFGENKRHIRQLLHELDAKLKSHKDLRRT